MNTKQPAEYAFPNQWDLGLRRVQAIEAAYDPVTVRRLTQIGISAGFSCLEVGAGAGSVARWMARAAGPAGRVTALDLDTRFLTSLPSNVDVVQADIRTQEPARDSYDIVHTRLLLNHLADPERVIAVLVRSLRPGGKLLLEEGDAFAVGTLDDDEDHNNCMRKWIAAFAATGADIELGRHLPRLLDAAGIEDVESSGEVPFVRGGTAAAEWLMLTYDQLNAASDVELAERESYLRWKAKLVDPATRFANIALFGAWGRRPH